MPESKHKKRDVQRPRSFWSGTIAFGLVSIPVSLYIASRSGGISLRMVDRDGTPLRRRYFCSKDAGPLEADDIVRGYEVEKDQFVIVKDEELEALAPEKSREIDLKRFVPLDQIDPIWFERGYFLAPDKGAMKAYRLLANTMEQKHRAGIATFVMRDKEYLVAIIGQQGLLRAETLRFHDELRTPDDIGLPTPDKVDAARIKAMQKEIRALSSDDLDPELLSDAHRHQLRELIDRKLAEGTDVVEAPEAAEEEEPESAEVVDLMAILKQSLGKSDGSPAKRGKDSALDDLSKTELYERARELDIPGRSKLSREQLIEAIRAKS
ncbi:MAG: Ku protein [Thiogranum sp.]|nr:Ku protein [Thiogranum sp.]